MLALFVSCSLWAEAQFELTGNKLNHPPTQKKGIPGYSNISKLLLSYSNVKLLLINSIYLHYFTSPRHCALCEFSCPPFQDLKANSNATALKMRPHWQNVVLLLLQTDLRQQRNHHNSVIRARIPPAHPPPRSFHCKSRALCPIGAHAFSIERLFSSL